MNKKMWTGWIAVFVVLAVLDFLINAVLMSSAYKETAQLWRPEGEMKIWLFYVVDIIIAFFFSLIFSKGYEGKGVSEGARYGFYVGMLMSVPMAYGMYGSMPIPYSMALQWFIYGTIMYTVSGVVIAMVYGKQACVTKVAAS